MSLASALYVGHVRHRRSRPHAHGFRYRIAQLYVDLDELPQVVAGRWLWSLERRNLAAFHRADYHGDPAIPLKQAVLDTVESRTGERPGGAVRMLAHWRYFGYCFNPVSFYYCFDTAGRLHSIVAEITNTPWGERHSYVLPLRTASHHGTGGRVHAWAFDKIFHVSPFLPMDLRYDWRFEEPGEHLRVHMDVADAQGSIFAASSSRAKGTDRYTRARLSRASRPRRSASRRTSAPLVITLTGLRCSAHTSRHARVIA